MFYQSSEVYSYNFKPVGEKFIMKNRPFFINGEPKFVFPKDRKKSYWSLSENAKYIVFIQKNHERMHQKEHKYLWGIYREMSEFIESRNFRQCKLHHQKLLNEFLSIPQITSILRERYPQIVKKLDEMEKLYTNFLQNNFERKKIESQKNISKNLIATEAVYEEDGQNKDPIIAIGAPRESNSEKMKQCHQYFFDWLKKMGEWNKDCLKK